MKVIDLENICQWMQYHKKTDRHHMASDGNIPQHLWNGLAQNIELEYDQVSRFSSHFIGDTGGKAWDDTYNKKIQPVERSMGQTICYFFPPTNNLQGVGEERDPKD